MFGFKTIPGWALNIGEVSNNVYQVELRDSFGRQASYKASDLEQAIFTCETYAFDIEKQINKSWTKFLFDLCIQKSADNSIESHEFSDKDFGSWTIEYKDKRIILDNKENWIIQQVRINLTDWADKEFIKIPELTYLKLIEFVEAK